MLSLFCGVLSFRLARLFSAVPRTSVARIGVVAQTPNEWLVSSGDEPRSS